MDSVTALYDAAQKYQVIAGVSFDYGAKHNTREIAKRGQELGVDFSYTWSCYKGSDLHCGKCGTCVERREAFMVAGIKDPTVYTEEGPLPRKPDRL
jgi:7-cyano-7-deazaguanine synthase in queuosine biosynthesis